MFSSRGAHSPPLSAPLAARVTMRRGRAPAPDSDEDFDTDMDSGGETRGRPALTRLRRHGDPRAAGVGPRRGAAKRARNGEGARNTPQRAVHAAQEAARIAALSPEDRAADTTRVTAGQAALRGAQTPEERADAKERNRIEHAEARAALTAEEKAAWRQARDARHAAQGPFTAAAPDNMPSDAYLDTFEDNPVAARALFWARFGNWPFARWRNMSDDASARGA